MSIAAIINAAGFNTRQAGAIEKLIQPSIRIHSDLSDDRHLPPGTSKLGGQPDLPPGFNWPVFDDSPLSFLAQLNILDFKQYDTEGVLPPEGMLYFFYNNEKQPWGFDPADRGNWLVAYSNTPRGQLLRTAPPPQLHQDNVFKTGKLSFSPEDTIPGRETLFIQDLHFDDEAMNKYHSLLDKYHGLLEQASNLNNPKINRLLGHPQEIQSEMQQECQLVSHGLYLGDPKAYDDPRVNELKPGSRNWRLLFQLDSEENLGMFWGDVGRLYFWMTQESLKTGDFDQAWLVLQCY